MIAKVVDRDMEKMLNFLELLTGSDKETLLKARSEVAQLVGSTKVSNSQEKEYVFNCFINLMVELTDPNYINRYSLGYTLTVITDYITQRYQHEQNMIEFLQTVNRVLVHYYGFKLNNPDTLYQAFEKMGDELELYMKKLL